MSKSLHQVLAFFFLVALLISVPAAFGQATLDTLSLQMKCTMCELKKQNLANRAKIMDLEAHEFCIEVSLLNVGIGVGTAFKFWETDAGLDTPFFQAYPLKWEGIEASLAADPLVSLAGNADYCFTMWSSDPPDVGDFCENLFDSGSCDEYVGESEPFPAPDRSKVAEMFFPGSSDDTDRDQLMEDIENAALALFSTSGFAGDQLPDTLNQLSSLAFTVDPLQLSPMGELLNLPENIPFSGPWTQVAQDAQSFASSYLNPLDPQGALMDMCNNPDIAPEVAAIWAGQCSEVLDIISMSNLLISLMDDLQSLLDSEFADVANEIQTAINTISGALGTISGAINGVQQTADDILGLLPEPAVAAADTD